MTGAYLLAGLWVTVILSLRHWRRPACVCTGLLLAALLRKDAPCAPILALIRRTIY